MARITVEDCLEKLGNQFEVVQVAAHRARQLEIGMPAKVEEDGDRPTVIALREIAEGLITKEVLNEPINEFKDADSELSHLLRAGEPGPTIGDPLPDDEADDGEDTLAADGGETVLAADGGETMLATGSGEAPLATDGGETMLATGSGEAPLATDGGETTLATGSGEAPLATDGGETTLATDSGEAPLATDGGETTLATDDNPQDGTARQPAEE